MGGPVGAAGVSDGLGRSEQPGGMSVLAVCRGQPREGLQAACDPPHVGHLMVSSWLRWTDRVDEVWWVPVAAHPFGKPLAPFRTRVEWCSRALAGVADARVDPIEEQLPT